ncbi:unnamed protein product [Nezara viridula]|uniref:Uncharacterized protein n=1 Tax=Nezara viridula TaxID=85310 RepID=A0A9P0E7G5_NEZVI|nr:unnamed protein product [Nezara viridula]
MMSAFQVILRDWVKTSGFLTHELVKRFFIIYPLICIASDCYLQVQVAFQAWFETIDSGAAAQAEPQASAPSLPQEVSMASTEANVTRASIPSWDSRPPVVGEPGSDPEQPIDVEEAVRLLAEDLRSEISSAEDRWE